MKDRIIKLILKTIMMIHMFGLFICLAGQLLYGKSVFLDFVFFFFLVQALKLYITAEDKNAT